MDANLIKDLLEHYSAHYNQLGFIDQDPIQIPHRYSKPEDIEIIGFWVAILAWGNRKSIVAKGLDLCRLMEDTPYDFIRNHKDSDRKRFSSFIHRTFNATDSYYFLEFLQNWYEKNKSLESAFLLPDQHQGIKMESMLEQFYQNFFSMDLVPGRTRKHVSRPETGSRCKRLLMYLRWMVRKDDNGVDFGIWKTIHPSQLMIPLDVHVERSARKLGMLTRKSLDWKAVRELSDFCSHLRPEDPAFYDYGLFGISLENRTLEKNI